MTSVPWILPEPNRHLSHRQPCMSSAVSQMCQPPHAPLIPRIKCPQSLPCILPRAARPTSQASPRLSKTTCQTKLTAPAALSQISQVPSGCPGTYLLCTDPSRGNGAQCTQGETGGRLTTDTSAFLLERIGRFQPDRNQEHNCTAWAQCPLHSVPLPIPLGVFLSWCLQVMEVEVGHHVPHGQHQPVQALVMVQALGPSVLGPLIL